MPIPAGLLTFKNNKHDQVGVAILASRHRVNKQFFGKHWLRHNAPKREQITRKTIANKEFFALMH